MSAPTGNPGLAAAIARRDGARGMAQAAAAAHDALRAMPGYSHEAWLLSFDTFRNATRQYTDAEQALIDLRFEIRERELQALSQAAVQP